MTELDRDAIFVNNHLARTDFYHYTRYMYYRQTGAYWRRAAHHEIICRALERVFRGECRRLIINIPPRYSKTELCLNFITWALGLAPWSNFILTSYSSELAEQNSWKAREQAKSEPYQSVFPHVTIDNTSSARHKWHTTAGGGVYASSTEGTITGFGAGGKRPEFCGCILIDDPLKPTEARSDKVRNGVIDWYKSTLQSRVNDPKTPIILIMQRLHEDDLAGWLMAGGSGEDWELISLPALQADGTALWHEMHSLEELRRMESAMPYTFAGQYQQTPTPASGGIFKPDMLKFAESLAEVGPIAQWVRAWDLAATQDDGDWTCGTAMGRTSKGGYVIADLARLQGSPDVVENAIVGAARMDRMVFSGIKTSLPQDPGQAGKSQVFYLTKALAGFSVVSSPESGDKVTRAEPFAAQVNVGNVTLMRGEYILGLMDEMRNFPNGKHDDRIDACSRAFNHLTENTSLNYAAMSGQMADYAKAFKRAGAQRFGGRVAR